MKPLTLTTNFIIFNSVDELPSSIQELLQHAKKASEKAYAPYSHLKVGAALLLENGEIVTGNNQENASYPSGLCAERVAVYQAGAQFPDIPIKALAITASSSHKNTLNASIPPCGACRQALAEYEMKQNSPIEIYFMGEEATIIKAHSLSDLLPFLFKKSSFL